MMSKFYKIFIAILLSFVIVAPEAEAVSKLDFTEPMSDIAKKVEKVKEKIEQKYHEVMEKLNGKIRKALGAEGAALFNDLVVKRASNIVKNALKGQFDVGDLSLKGLSNSMLSQLGDFKLDAANLQAFANDLAMSLEKAKLAKTQQMHIKLSEFEAERSIVNKALLADPNNAELKAKLDDLDINVANMQGQIREAMAENKLQDERLEKYKSELAAFNEQIANLSVQKMSEDLLKTLNAKIASLFPSQDDEDVQEVYGTSISRLFLAEYEAESSENLTNIIKARHKEYYESVKNMAREYLNMINDVEKSSERSKQCADAMGTADGISGQQTMQICTDLQNARAAAGTTSVMLARLRYRAIADMQGWNNMYKLRDYSRDPTKFNLDNYIFSKKDLTFNVKDELRKAIGNFKGF
ncbi:MAG: hypothetical protein J6N49_02635 [Alphaproteobacteria bacterium]|nr:hypothetical protein [Alphaproteobacteria bacterium]